MIKYQHGAISFRLADDVTEDAREVVTYAATTYGFVLNTPKHVNRWRTWRQFADAIKQVYSTSNPQNARVVEVLESL